MRNLVVIVAGLFVLLLASDARAQRALSESRLMFGVSGGAQVGGHDETYRSTFPVYDEAGEVAVSQNVGDGAILDVGAMFRVKGRLGVGIAYTALQSSGDADLVGSVPHPLFYDRPRGFSSTVTELDRDEKAVHLQAVWLLPFGDRMEIALAGGPSFFNVNQELVRGVTFTENPPDYSTVTIESVDVADSSGWGVGFNIGADVTYAFTDNLGAGVLLRYARGSVDLDLSEGETAELEPGGFQIAAGLRLRF